MVQRPHQIWQDLAMSLLTTAEIWRRKDGLSGYDVTEEVHSRIRCKRGCLLANTHLQRSVCSYVRYEECVVGFVLEEEDK